MFYRAGVVCTCGSKIRRDFVPDRTATVLARLDAAGALDVGGLNLSEFAHGPTGHNAHFGACRNPWNPAHISGGSSSGSGCPCNYYYDTVVPEVKALLDGSLRELEGLGAEIVEVTVPHHEHIAHLQHIVQTSEAATLHADWLSERADDYGPQVRARILPGLATPATWYLRALQLRARIVSDFVEQVFGMCDVLHLPVFPIPVPTIEETDVGASREFTRIIAGIVRCTLPISFLTCPSIVMPCGFTGNGLPCSFQLAGRPFDEGPCSGPRPPTRRRAPSRIAPPTPDPAPPPRGGGCRGAMSPSPRARGSRGTWLSTGCFSYPCRPLCDRGPPPLGAHGRCCGVQAHWRLHARIQWP